MNFNRHSKFEGQHAFLSASKYHWINYDADKIVEAWTRFQALKEGTELHALAKDLIKHGVKLPRSKKTLNMYVNDAIGYKMTPEQILFYSPVAFGTADAISFRDGMLRIHDLKTGSTPASVHQLEVYAALFCLEYDFKPSEIQMELRLYQSNEVLIHEPETDDILPIMDKIITFDKIISKLMENGDE